MKPSINFKTTTSSLLTRPYRYAKHCGRVLFVLGCFVLSEGALAVGPDTDGAIPGANNGEGVGVLLSLTSGIWNTGTGFVSLRNNTSGTGDTANGANTLQNNTTGNFNTATGAAALLSNTIGSQNTATGFAALYHNTGSVNNTANGYLALFSNTSGNLNTANGSSALESNTGGGGNTANGAYALNNNTTGTGNTANGANTLQNNTTSDLNTATGDSALQLNTTGARNTALGENAGRQQTTGSDNVYIGQGMEGVAGESNACYIKSIFGQTSINGIPVLINSDNKLGTLTSSKRFKEDIKPMDKASETLLALKPVAFRYKKEIDPAGTAQFGLVAEEVKKVNPALVLPDKEGKPYTVRYDAVNVMLLNEFLKEHKKVEEQQATIGQLRFNAAKQEATISELRKGMETVVSHLKEQDSKIQKMSAQLEMRKHASQTASNP